MASAQFNESQTARTEATSEEWMDAVKEAASATTQKTGMASQKANESSQSQLTKHESGGFLQQTREQMTHMAHDAMEEIKNTLGVKDHKK